MSEEKRSHIRRNSFRCSGITRVQLNLFSEPGCSFVDRTFRDTCLILALVFVTLVTLERVECIVFLLSDRLDQTTQPICVREPTGHAHESAQGFTIPKKQGDERRGAAVTEASEDDVLGTSWHLVNLGPQELMQVRGGLAEPRVLQLLAFCGRRLQIPAIEPLVRERTLVEGGPTPGCRRENKAGMWKSSGE